MGLNTAPRDGICIALNTLAIVRAKLILHLSFGEIGKEFDYRT